MFCSLAYPISSVRALFILVLVAFSWFIAIAWISHRFSGLASSWSAHSSCKFLRFISLYVFLHSSCSVVVSYFMLIPAFVILLFSVTMFSACING